MQGVFAINFVKIDQAVCFRYLALVLYWYMYTRTDTKRRDRVHYQPLLYSCWRLINIAGAALASSLTILLRYICLYEFFFYLTYRRNGLVNFDEVWEEGPS